MPRSLESGMEEPHIELPEGWNLVKGRDTSFRSETWDELLASIGPTTHRQNVHDAAPFYKPPVFGGLARVRYIKPFAPTAGIEALEWARTQKLFPASLYHIGAELQTHRRVTGSEGLNDRFISSKGGILATDFFLFKDRLCTYALGWNMVDRRQSVELVSADGAFQTWHAFVCDVWEKQP
jgi:hypothetical protein